MNNGRSLPAFISPGALVDRLTILQLKVDRLRDPNVRRIAERELTSLRAVRAETGLLTRGGDSEAERLRAINRELWDLENEVRRSERQKLFGAPFVDAASRIHRLNAERADVRAVFDEKVSTGPETELVEVNTGLDSYADQIAIAEVRAARVPATGGFAQEVLRDVWRAYEVKDIFSDTLYLSLKQANSRLWTIKDKVARVLQDGVSETADIAELRAVYLVNDVRHRLKVALAIHLDSALYDVKQYASYDAPPEWDPSTLAFTKC